MTTTTTHALEYLLFIAVAFTAAEIVLGLWLSRRRRYYKNIVRTERIRLQIGDARCRLMRVAANGELSHETATFRDLYFIQTAMMRGTDAYPQISEAMWRKVLRFERRTQTALSAEAETWTPEVREIANQTADAIRKIWIEYVPFGLLLRFARRLLVRIGLLSYERMEQWCDEMLRAFIGIAETMGRLVERATFAYFRGTPFGAELRLAIEMRETEVMLRRVVDRAA
jgi:hypothetical protein